MSWVTAFVRRAAGLDVEKPKQQAAVSSEIPEYGGIYFVQTGASEDGAVKIGKAANIRHRLRGLQTAQPWALRLLHHERIDDEDARVLREAELHDRFKRFHIRGEWFDFAIMKHVVR